MQTIELKLKQACAVLGVSAKDLQNLVQLGVIRPARRDSVCRFDYKLLLEAKVALYLKESLGCSSALLGKLTQVLSGRTGKKRGRQENIRLRSRPNGGTDSVEIIIPLGSLAEELDRRLPIAAACKDLPRGRRRPGWKKEFMSSVGKASENLGVISDPQILKAVREYRSNRKKLPEITIVARSKKKTA